MLVDGDGLDRTEKWAELLPEGCPPLTAKPITGLFWRLSKTASAVADTFKSKHAIGLPASPDTTLCHHASCSFFEKDDNDDHHEAIRKLPRFKKFFSHAFLVHLDESMGVGERSKKGSHVHFWFYHGTLPANKIQTTRKCGL
jgi:hypothetical protein